MTQMFSIKEAIVFGWHKLKQHSGLVFGVVLTMFALQVVTSMVEKSLENTLLGVAASIVLAVAGIVLGCGMTLIFLKLAKNEHAQYRDIVPKAWLVWKYFCASFITGVIAFVPVMVGALLSLALLISTGSVTVINEQPTPVAGHLAEFIIAALLMAVAVAAAVYLSLRYSMARLAVLDHSDILESLRKSTKLTHGVKGHLMLFALALVALNLLGFAAFIVGLLVTIPISLLAFAHVYLKLKSHHGHN